MSFIGNKPDGFGYTQTSYDHFNGDGVTTVLHPPPDYRRVSRIL